MLFNECVFSLKELTKTNEKIKKQLCCLQGLQWIYRQENFQIDQEYRLTFDISELLEEYSWKAGKCQYFLGKYLDGILKELRLQAEYIKDIPKSKLLLMGKTYLLDEAVYNFDAFVLATSVLMERESIPYMAKYLRKLPIANYYPKRTDIGLYWQLNLLRNRIVHHTGGRYANGKICQRYSDFSSKINGIGLKNGHIELQCTQIDVYRSPEVQKEIERVLLTGDDSNVFDCLFPEKSGKGHGKKNPGVLYPGVILYFDHATSGVRFVSEVQQFILNMNEAFFVEFFHKLKNKKAVLETETIYYQDGIEVKLRVKDLFDINKVSMV